MDDLAPSQLEPTPTPWVERSDPSADDRAAYVEAVIRHRCPELTEDDFVSARDKAEPVSEPVMMIPHEVGRQIEDALEAIIARLDWIERRLGAPDRRLTH